MSIVCVLPELYREFRLPCMRTGLLGRLHYGVHRPWDMHISHSGAAEDAYGDSVQKQSTDQKISAR